MAEAWTTPNPCNVAASLSDQARAQPDAPAIHFPTGVKSGTVQYESASYRELDELSDQYARGLLAYGITEGKRVALMVPPGREFFALFFALFKAGVVPVLIDPGIGLKPLKECLAEARPEAFIGITKAHIARVLLGWSRDTITKNITVGPRLAWGGIRVQKLAQLGREGQGWELCGTEPDDMAAILFTSGSTGIPKGVVYKHKHFHHQVEMLRDRFGIEAGEIDLATFPPFALFDPALGMTTVVPHMDPTRPAKANPEYLVQAIRQFGVTNAFGSPALLKVLGAHLEAKGETLETVKRVLSAGAAVPAATIRLMEEHIAPGGLIHTPYGATECLPVATVSNRELDQETADRAGQGHGTCVGKPVEPNRVEIIELSDEKITSITPRDFLSTGEVGEIVVFGPTTTEAYWARDEQTALAKCRDEEGNCWHRMGDIGYLDEHGRLWYCGRKSQRVRTTTGDLYADQVEAVFNTHPDVDRTALVGVGKPGTQQAVLCVESRVLDSARDDLRQALLSMANKHGSLEQIGTVLFHPSFPVDIRHNSKIGREKLAEWAGQELS